MHRSPYQVPDLWPRVVTSWTLSRGCTWGAGWLRPWILVLSPLGCLASEPTHPPGGPHPILTVLRAMVTTFQGTRKPRVQEAHSGCCALTGAQNSAHCFSRLVGCGIWLALGAGRPFHQPPPTEGPLCFGHEEQTLRHRDLGNQCKSEQRPPSASLPACLATGFPLGAPLQGAQARPVWLPAINKREF